LAALSISLDTSCFVIHAICTIYQAWISMDL